MGKCKEVFDLDSLKNRFLFDYLTINFRNLDPDGVLQLLTTIVDSNDVCPASFEYFDTGALTSYNRSLRFFSERFITINWRECEDGMPFGFTHTGEVSNFDVRQGVSLNITGTGCRFMTEQDFAFLFKACEQYEVSYTRIDVAFDDFENLIPCEEMIDSFHRFLKGEKTVSSRSKLSTCRSYINVSNIGGQNVFGENFDLGSNGSSQRLRFYDKKVEQSRSDVEYWKRLEFTLRHQKAVDFINDYMHYGNIVVPYVKYLSSIIRFLTENNVTSRGSSRISNAVWWDEFLQALEEYEKFSKEIFWEELSFSASSGDVSDDKKLLTMRQLLEQKTESFIKQYSTFISFLRKYDFSLYQRIFERGFDTLEEGSSSSSYVKLYRKLKTGALSDTSLLVS